ncbi:MAG: formyltransferase family protein [Candidatus Aenigmarchaeota archaeon]|nr:formyltransferase family protein [Candidatus Aenigmarchaeota archaeon]
MKYKLLFDPKIQPMRVACFMSGSGTNVRKIIEHQIRLKKERGKPPYEVVVIFTDNPESNAKIIAEEYGIPLKVNDIKKFYHGRDIKDMSVREEFDKKTVELIESYEPDAIALGGYAWVITKPLLSKYLIINVHPADLSVVERGKRKYVGLYHTPSMKAILAGEKFLHSSTHIVTENLDMGEILVISKPLRVKLPEGITIEDLKKPENKELLIKIAEEHQNKLKEVGDWEIFPLTLEWIAEGRFAIDDNRNIYFDGKLIKNGYRL